MIWASVIAGSAAVIAAALGAYNARKISHTQVKLQEVHDQLHDEVAEAKDEPNHS